jgi:hypothetical protein
MEAIDTERYTHIKSDEVEAWYKDRKLHRDDNHPARIYDGRKDWFQNGIPYRENGLPHTEYSNGTKEWYEVCYENGRIVWYSAIYEGLTSKTWSSKGRLHREERDLDGLLLPARIYYDGREQYFIHGEEVNRHGVSTELLSNRIK